MGRGGYMAGSNARNPTHDRHKQSQRPSKPRKQSQEDVTLSELRLKIRQTSRLLEHDDKISKTALTGKKMDSRPLPAHIRIEKERALKGYQHDLGRAEKRFKSTRQHNKMISKYHAVRFYERQKAERRLKKAQRALDEGEDDQEALRLAQADLNYILYLPLDEKYVGLFPNKNDDPHCVRSSANYKKIQEVYLTAVEEGLKDEDLQERMFKIRDEGWSHTATSRTTPSETRHVPRVAISRSVPAPKASQDDQEMDSDSDGFFQ